MDTLYKGYTITPNSEHRPDGLWLPVAEIEFDDKRSVTTLPPLRAKTPAARKTQDEADEAALQMAKDWIDAQ
jgi:hypothetical protein